MNPSPMHVLMLIHRLADNSPYCLYVHERAKALRELGHRVTVIAPVPWLPGYGWLRPSQARIMRDTPKQAQADGMQIYYPRYLSLGNTGARLVGGWPMYRAVLPILRRIHREHPVDILHAHMLPIEGHAALRLGKTLGIPAALTVHGTDVFHYFDEPGEQARQPWKRNRRIAAEIPLLMAVSEKLARRVRPYRAAPLPVLHNGVDLSLIPARQGAAPQALISVGTLKARKCMHTTLAAFCALAPEFPQATLTIVGDGPDRPDLEAQARAHGLQDRVTLTGPIPHEEVFARMAASDAFIMPSYGEGEGIVYIEAMAAGCVAVGSQDEGIAELITDGYNGYLVPAGDTQALIPVMRALFVGGEAVETIRRRGSQDARRLTWAFNAQEAAALYRQTIAACAGISPSSEREEST